MGGGGYGPRLPLAADWDGVLWLFFFVFWWPVVLAIILLLFLWLQILCVSCVLS